MTQADGISQAESIEAQAAHWLRKSELCDWQESDDAALAAWLSQSMNHSVAYWRLKAAWKRAERITAIQRAAEIKSTPALHRPYWPFFLGAAASIAAIAVIVIGLPQILPKQDIQSYTTEIGGHETVTFSDGTRVELNTDTAVRARMTTAERTIWLDRGEAYFQVQHDAAHPLNVFVAGHRVTDLGTEFLVRDDANYLEVALLQGRARVENVKAPKSAPPVTLVPGDVALATTDAMSVTKMNTQDLQGELGWRRGVLVFYHTTLGDAVAELNRYNRQKITIADPSAMQMRINGTFPANNAELFGRVAQVVLKLHVENRGGEIVISR